MSNIFDAMLQMISITLLFTIPLSIWKLIDIGIWIYRHLEVSVK